MDKTLNRGERIWRNLLNSDREDIAATNWLLLFTIYKNKNIRSKDVRKKLGKNWKKVHKENPEFYLIWKEYCDVGEDLMEGVLRGLIRFENMCFIEITKWKDRKPCWSLAEKGENLLYDSMDRVKKILGSIVHDL